MLSQSVPSIVQHRMAALFAGSEASTHSSILPVGQWSERNTMLASGLNGGGDGGGGDGGGGDGSGDAGGGGRSGDLATKHGHSR